MLLIRPLIRANDNRKHRVHVVIFFIFLVANIGGGLTPLGDPPLFIGFLKGVDFFWTAVHMLPPVLISSLILLVMFYFVDSYYYKREDEIEQRDQRQTQSCACTASSILSCCWPSSAVFCFPASGAPALK